MNSNRVDVSHEYTYPTHPDARGSTRINHKRRPYYLGPHESPLSYVMFGLWKHRLQETGEPPSTKEIRALADEILVGGRVASVRPSTSKIRASSVVCALAGVLLLVVLSNIFFSRGSVPKVDDVVLSDSEADIVRAFRQRRFIDEGAQAAAFSDVAITMQQLLSEGSDGGPKHIAGSNF